MCREWSYKELAASGYTLNLCSKKGPWFFQWTLFAHTTTNSKFYVCFCYILFFVLFIYSFLSCFLLTESIDPSIITPTYLHYIYSTFTRVRMCSFWQLHKWAEQVEKTHRQAALSITKVYQLQHTSYTNLLQQLGIQLLEDRWRNLNLYLL